MSSGAGANASRRTGLLTVFRVVIVIAAIATVWSTIRLEPWSDPGRSAARADSPILWTDVNPIGVNTFLAKEVEPWKRERTLEMTAAMGAGWIKEHFPWRAIETSPGVYWDDTFHQDAWAKYDAIVDAAEQHGLRIIARIDYAPAWARPLGSGLTAPPENYDAFGNFIAEFVRRYQGRVQFIQIWNEPNLSAEWGGDIDPEGYARLLEAAATAARAVDPNVVILSAPLAMTTENSERAMDDLSYWQALYDAGAGSYFDIMSANAYGLDQPYNADPDIERLNIRRIELIRDIAVANGDVGKPIWLNEYGWNAAPEDFPEELLIWSRVPEESQADWARDGIEYLRSEHEWFGVANTWYFRQVGDVSSARADYYFRAVDFEFTPRPLYRSLSSLGERLAVASPGRHNDLAPSIRTTGVWSIERSSSSSSGQHLVGAPGGEVQIRFKGNHLVAELAEGQQETVLWVTVAASDSGDDRNAERREARVAEGQRRVQLYDGPNDMAPATHAVTIVVEGDAPLLLDGIDVQYRRSYRAMAAGTIVFLASLAGYVALRRGLLA